MTTARPRLSCKPWRRPPISTDPRAPYGLPAWGFALVWALIQDRGHSRRPDAVQRQRAATELALDAGRAGVQDDRIDGRGATGDLSDDPDGGVVPADVDGGHVRPGQDEADDLAVDEAVAVTLAVLRPCTAGKAVTVSSPPSGRRTAWLLQVAKPMAGRPVA